MPVHPLAEACLTILCDQTRLVILPNEIVQVVVCFEDDIAAASAVAAARSAFRTILLALKSDAALAAVSRPCKDLDFVNEHRRMR